MIIGGQRNGLLRPRWSGPLFANSSGGASSTITSLSILDNTLLPDGTDAAVPNGWAAVAVLPDDGVSTFDPKKISFTVRDPGFDSNGSPIPVTRVIVGTEVIRKQYSHQAERLNSASGGSRTVYFALSEEVFQGSTILSANADAGYYGAAQSGSVSAINNASTLAYPKPLFGWLSPQHMRATGAGLPVEAVAYHGLARNGQQVACVKFTARDAAGNYDTVNAQVASTPALSSLQTQGPIVEAWKATLPLANMPQGNLCYVNAEVYPWIGDAGSVLNLAVDGVATGAGTAVSSVNPQTPLRFLCDKSGTYGGGIAYVRTTGTLTYTGTNGATTSTAGVFTTPQSGLTNAQCYPDILAALAALKNWNNVNKGHNDHSGSTVYLMDDGAGGAVAHQIPTCSQITAGKCWTDIRVDPNATGAVTMQIGTISSTAISPADLLRFWVNTTQFGYFRGVGAAYNRLAWSGCTIAASGTPAAAVSRESPYNHFLNVTLANIVGNAWPLAMQGNLRMFNHCVGVIGTGAGGKTNSHLLVGCRFVNAYFTGVDLNSFTLGESLDGAIYANTMFYNAPQYCNFESETNTRGLAVVQVVIERPGTGGNPALQIHGDGADNGCRNIIIQHVTTVGEPGGRQGRANLLYMVHDAQVGVQRSGYASFNLFHNLNRKTDTFTGLSTLTGRTGNWKWRYGVAQLGNVSITGDASGGAGTEVNPSGGNWIGEARDAYSFFNGLNTTFTNPQFGSAQSGQGTYSLTGASNDAYSRVPAGRGVLKYDLAGNLRRQDGSGAAGAYERTV